MQIPEIIQMAKDHLLEHGEHIPELYVEFQEKELNLIAFADFPYTSNLKKQEVFFGLGRKLGKESPGKEISQIIFIVEAWVSTQKRDEPRKYKQPSDDPNRKEVLIIQVLELHKLTRHLKESAHIVDMIRDGSGELVDLYHRSEEQHGKVHSTLLTAFLAGFESTKLPDEELARMVEQAIKKAMK